jgi:DNA-3-methyladenine glycosylase
VRLERSFYSVDPVTLARSLLGQRLVRVLDDGTRVAGVIVETEAYLGVPDRAAHSHGGRRTPRTEAMYLPGGAAYVYFTYGMHFCFNVVAGEADDPVAVLVRALEPTEGLDQMRQRRGGVAVERLCRGPANLCRALAIDRTLNGLDLTTDPRLMVEEGGRRIAGVTRSARVGVAYAGPWARRLLRFCIRDHPGISGPRPRPRGRS